MDNDFMPFVAIDENKKKVNTFDNLKEIDEMRSKKNLFWCPHCNGEMIFNHGNVVIPHFSHKVICPYQTEPESQKHLAMKAYIKNKFPTAELEVRMGNRINDVCFGDIAIECQVSPITQEEIITRTKDYNKMGKSVFWFLGSRIIERDKQSAFFRQCEVALQDMYDGVYFYQSDNSVGQYYFKYLRGREKKGYFLKRYECAGKRFSFHNIVDGMMIAKLR